MSNNYNFGNVDIEFNTNKIFLLIQTIYRIESIEDKINSSNGKLSHLAESLQQFIDLIEKNKQGLEEFNKYKSNAENNNMWAEYGEYIISFAQSDINSINNNPKMAVAIKELINSNFFTEVEKLNNEYSIEMENKFIDQTQNHKKQAENIVGNTKTKKIIYMPFTPELFSIEPCCLSDKNGNGEYAVQFTIPTNKDNFEESFGMEYTEGIESVILFHEKLHADLPTKDSRLFKNRIQRELDSHLKHAIIELMSNGEMGIELAKHSSYFSSVFHTGKIFDGESVLQTGDLQRFGIKDNELLHTELDENNGKDIEHYSKEDMGIIKIRGMIYPYVLMYKNRNNNNQVEAVMQQIQKDEQMIKNIYGEDFLNLLLDEKFLLQVQASVKPYNSLLEFAEGMSKELLGIEQVREFSEQQIGKATINTPTVIKDKTNEQINRDREQINKNDQQISE